LARASSFFVFAFYFFPFSIGDADAKRRAGVGMPSPMPSKATSDLCPLCSARERIHEGGNRRRERDKSEPGCKGRKEKRGGRAMKLKRERLPADPRFFALSIKKVFAFFGRRANGSRVFFSPRFPVSLSPPISLPRATAADCSRQ
jgi:hypothetical protein